jgi:hypothetical protein
MRFKMFKPFNRFAPFKSLNPSNGFANEFPKLINDLNLLNDLNKF